MRSIVLLLVSVVLVGTVSAEPVLNTNFLSPAMPSYNNLGRYYFLIQSGNGNVCYMSNQCYRSTSLSPQLQSLYATCGAHNFQPTEVYNFGWGPNPALPVGFVSEPLPTQPNAISMWLRVNSDSAASIDPASPAYNGANSQNIVNCLSNYPVLQCLSAKDIAMLNCITNTTDVPLDPQPCKEPLSDGAIVGIAIGGTIGGCLLLVALFFVCRCACRRCRNRTDVYEAL